MSMLTSLTRRLYFDNVIAIYWFVFEGVMLFTPLHLFYANKPKVRGFLTNDKQRIVAF